MASLEGDNLVLFYYLSASEIWHDKRGRLWWEGSYKMDITALIFLTNVNTYVYS